MTRRLARLLRRAANRLDPSRIDVDQKALRTALRHVAARVGPSPELDGIMFAIYGRRAVREVSTIINTGADPNAVVQAMKRRPA